MLGRLGASKPVIGGRILFIVLIGLLVPRVTWITLRRWGLCVACGCSLLPCGSVVLVFFGVVVFADVGFSW